MKVKILVKRKGLFRKNKTIELNVDNGLKKYLAGCAVKYIKHNVIEPYINRHMPYSKTYVWQNEKEVLNKI